MTVAQDAYTLIVPSPSIDIKTKILGAYFSAFEHLQKFQVGVPTALFGSYLLATGHEFGAMGMFGATASYILSMYQKDINKWKPMQQVGNAIFALGLGGAMLEDTLQHMQAQPNQCVLINTEPGLDVPDTNCLVVVNDYLWPDYLNEVSATYKGSLPGVILQDATEINPRINQLHAFYNGEFYPIDVLDKTILTTEEQRAWGGHVFVGTVPGQNPYDILRSANIVEAASATPTIAAVQESIPQATTTLENIIETGPQNPIPQEGTAGDDSSVWLGRGLIGFGVAVFLYTLFRAFATRNND